MSVAEWHFWGLCLPLLYTSCGLRTPWPAPCAHPSVLRLELSPEVVLHIHSDTVKARPLYWTGLGYFFPVLSFGTAREKIKQKEQRAQWFSAFTSILGDFKNAYVWALRLRFWFSWYDCDWTLIHWKNSPRDLMCVHEYLGPGSILMIPSVWFLDQQYQHPLGSYWKLKSSGSTQDQLPQTLFRGRTQQSAF